MATLTKIGFLGLTLPVAEHSSDSHPPNRANFWPSYEDILGPFAGCVKQVIAKEQYSPVQESHELPETNWRYLLPTNRIKRFLQIWVEGTGGEEPAIDLAPPPFFFGRQGFYCSCLMTVFQAPDTLFRQHFEGPHPFCWGFSLFSSFSFGIKYWFKPTPMPFFWYDYQKKCFCMRGVFLCEGTILLIKY